MLVPLLLAVAGVALIIVGQLDLDQPPVPSLPPIPDPTSPVALATPTPEASDGATPRPGVTQRPTPTPTPVPADWVAIRLEVESVGIRVQVKQGREPNCGFPLRDAVYVNCGGTMPGRGTNSYITGHAENHLFKPLWNVQLGALVKVLMSDGVVLRYVVTEIHPNVACPDDRADPHPSPPLALRYAPDDCREGFAWTLPTDHERLTMQTSQGYNRNWGELIVVAEPAA
jgi:hypothetical protein